MTRAIGDHDVKEYAISAPYVHSQAITSNNQYIILASDGLWDVVSDRDAIEFVQARWFYPMNVTAHMLAALARDRGNTDNITIVVAKLH